MQPIVRHAIENALLIGASIRDIRDAINRFATIDQWIAHRCVIDVRASMRMKTLYDDYIEWGGTESKSSFNRELGYRGYLRAGYIWKGLTTRAALVNARQQLQEIQR